MTRKTAAALVTAGFASLDYYRAEAKQQLFDLQDGTVREPAAVWALDPSSEWQLLCAALGLGGGLPATSILTTMRDMYDELPPELKLQLKHPLRFAAAEGSTYRRTIAKLPTGWTKSLAMMESLYDAEPAAVRSQYKHALLWAAAPASSYRRAIAELPAKWYESIKVMVELYDAQPAAVRLQYKHALLWAAAPASSYRRAIAELPTGWDKSLAMMESLYDAEPAAVRLQYKHALPWAAAEGGGRSVFAEHCARARRAANDASIHARSVVTAARLAARAAAHREDVEETLQRDRDGGIDIASWHTGGAFRSVFL